MARANLKISVELQSAFKSAIENNVRFIQASIKDEDILLVKSVKVSSTPEADFTSMASSLDAKTPVYILFNADTADAKSGKWTVVSYVPEFSNVRLKMLYSSSRDDIKSTLGKALFYNDFHATEKEEITWSAFQETKSNLRTAGPLTVREEFMREEAMASKSSSPSNAMGAVAFAFTPGLQEKLKAFSSGSINWVEMCVNTSAETTDVGAALNVTADNMIMHIKAHDPRFYLAKNDADLFFIYCCPDDSKVKERMMYSSCKAYIVDSVKAMGIVTTKTIEIRDASDFTDELKGVEVDASLASTSASFSRPTKPGRGRTKK